MKWSRSQNCGIEDIDLAAADSVLTFIEIEKRHLKPVHHPS